MSNMQDTPAIEKELSTTVYWKAKDGEERYVITQYYFMHDLYYLYECFDSISRKIDGEEMLTDQELAIMLYGRGLPQYLVNKTIMDLQSAIGKTDFKDYINMKFEGDVQES